MIEKLTNRFNGEEISVFVVKGDYNQLESKDVANIKNLFGGFASFAPNSRDLTGQDYVSHRSVLFPVDKGYVIVKRGEDYDNVMEVYRPYVYYDTFRSAYLTDEEMKTKEAPSYECILEFDDLPADKQKELHSKYNEVAFLKSENECYLLRQIFGQHIAEDRIDTYDDFSILHPEKCLEIDNIAERIAVQTGTKFAKKLKAMLQIQILADNYYSGLVDDTDEPDAWGIFINQKTGDYCSVYVKPKDGISFPMFYDKASADKFIKYNTNLLNRYFR